MLLELLFNKFLHLGARIEVFPSRLGGLNEFGVIRVLLLLRRKYKLELSHILLLKLISLLDLFLLHFLFFLESRSRLPLDRSFLEFYLLLFLVLLLFGKREVQ